MVSRATAVIGHVRLSSVISLSLSRDAPATVILGLSRSLRAEWQDYQASELAPIYPDEAPLEHDLCVRFGSVLFQTEIPNAGEITVWKATAMQPHAPHFEGKKNWI